MTATLKKKKKNLQAWYDSLIKIIKEVHSIYVAVLYQFFTLNNGVALVRQIIKHKVIY